VGSSVLVRGPFPDDVDVAAVSGPDAGSNGTCRPGHARHRSVTAAHLSMISMVNGCFPQTVAVLSYPGFTL